MTFQGMVKKDPHWLPKITFEAIGLSTYSNSKADVLSYVAIFENLWKQSELYQAIRESNEKLEINDKILNEFIHIAAQCE
jgi:hypothetical protein